MNTIDKDATYFVPMRPTHNFFGIGIIDSSDDLIPVECKITERRCKVSDRYKVELEPIEKKDSFTCETFYQTDFISLINSEHIIKRQNERQQVKSFFTHEYITENVYVVLPYYAIVD